MLMLSQPIIISCVGLIVTILFGIKSFISDSNKNGYKIFFLNSIIFIIGSYLFQDIDKLLLFYEALTFVILFFLMKKSNFLIYGINSSAIYFLNLICLKSDLSIPGIIICNISIIMSLSLITNEVFNPLIKFKTSDISIKILTLFIQLFFHIRIINNYNVLPYEFLGLLLMMTILTLMLRIFIINILVITRFKKILVSLLLVIINMVML